MTTYNLEGMVLKGLRSQRDFVSWANVFLFAQVLFIIQALMLNVGMKLEAGIVAVVAVWFIYQLNKF